MNRIRPAAVFRLMGTLATALCAGFSLAVSGAAAGTEPPSDVLNLQYQGTSEVLVWRSVGVKLLSASFRNEPPLSRSKQDVLRGLLQWGGASEKPMAFIWDRQQRKMYLDLNRNLDLSDDPAGILLGGTNSSFQSFTNVQLPRVTSAGVRPMLVQLNFSFYGSQNVAVRAGLCSYWHTKASLWGRDWQFGIVENVLEGQSAVSPQWLLLRPWSDRDRPFNLLSSTADLAEYSTNLFLGGRIYSLDCRYVPQDAAPLYQAKLTGQPASLGEVKLTGASIHRLIFKEDKGLVAIVDQPKDSFPLPAGNYSVEEIWLRGADIEVARFKAGKLVVTADKPAQLTAGGPLTNSVKVASVGHALTMTHEVLGADGGVYQFQRPNRERPPEVAIFDETNRLAAGKFSYG